MQAVLVDSPKTCYSHNGQELGDILGVAPSSPTAPSSDGSDLYKYSIRTLPIYDFPVALSIFYSNLF